MNSAMRPNFKEKFAEIVLVDPVNSAQDPQKKKNANRKKRAIQTQL